MKTNTRRDFLRTSAIVGAGWVLTSCSGGNMANTAEQETEETSSKPDEKKMGGEVTATEDLMREHGVLRRALLVYSAAAMKLRSNASSTFPDALQKTAKLFREFGEEYHERKLEELTSFQRSGRPVARQRLILTFSLRNTIADVRSRTTSSA